MDNAKRLFDILRRYGDHLWKCKVSKALRGEWPRTRPREAGEFPDCDCGWEQIRKEFFQQERDKDKEE